MYHTKLLVACIGIIVPAFLNAQPHEKVDIESATIFLNGAELTSKTKVALRPGENEVLFTNIAGNVNQESLTISSDKDVAVESYTYQNNYLVSDNLSPYAKVLKDSIEIIANERNTTNIQATVLDQEIALLQNNKDVRGQNTGLSVAELQKLLDLVNAKMGGYLNSKYSLQTRINKMDEHIQRLKKQLDEEGKKDFQPGGQLLVKFYAKNAVTSNIVFTYVVSNAGWTPSYDLKVEKLNDPVHLYYKANVHQNCGIKWDNVHITLSTGKPNENAQAPAMNPWYLAFYEPQPVRSYQYKAEKMESKSLSSMSIQGSRADDDQLMVEGMATAPTTLNEYVIVNNSGMNTKFDIDLPYTIPSDGQNHMVAIKSYEVPATYRYFAVPKLDENAYLQAEITKWEDLDLLPGATNIFYEGSYVGQGYIDAQNVKDTLNFSLGRDKKIVIKRERDKEKRSVKAIGTNVRESYVYNISVRNTKKDALDIVILDQVPVSNDKDIVIESTDTGNGERNETTGEVKWEFNIQPNETKKLVLGYTVKYPKGKLIAGL